MAVADGGGNAEHVVPAIDEAFGVYTVGEQARCRAPCGGGGESPEALVSEVADAGAEGEAGEIEQSEYEIRVAGGVGGVFFDLEVGIIVKDDVENVGGFSDGGGDDASAVLGVPV